ncbi:hypothetical protein [Glaciihabitans sp. UYNi722]|uniref:hypothetical protein n=1 Tax=Glaciihabitans sp. UYNi722 TaxID=3156344 RepID=UPI00339B6F8A
MPVVPEHRATEALIRASGLHFSLLRNNWYSEGYRATVEKARETGVIEGAAGDGRVASASRRDFAEAAAAVLTGTGHDNTVYELAGDTAWSFPELATIVSEITGRPVEYRNLSVEDYEASLAATGLPADIAGFVAAIDGAIAVGALADASGDLSRLIGRATTPVSETLR